ncbi:hypothetical protein GOV09_02775 [Candidatus Woesearchaeota archaeon]|nr:hypothetical protein [Candidatus Woesearchaeota archaeon]
MAIEVMVMDLGQDNPLNEGAPRFITRLYDHFKDAGSPYSVAVFDGGDFRQEMEGSLSRWQKDAPSHVVLTRSSQHQDIAEQIGMVVVPFTDYKTLISGLAEYLGKEYPTALFPTVLLDDAAGHDLHRLAPNLGARLAAKERLGSTGDANDYLNELRDKQLSLLLPGEIVYIGRDVAEPTGGTDINYLAAQLDLDARGIPGEMLGAIQSPRQPFATTRWLFPAAVNVEEGWRSVVALTPIPITPAFMQLERNPLHDPGMEFRLDSEYEHMHVFQETVERIVQSL